LKNIDNDHQNVRPAAIVAVGHGNAVTHVPTIVSAMTSGSCEPNRAWSATDTV